jgi:hypothetical protein
MLLSLWLLAGVETVLCGEPLREETAVPDRLLGRLTTVEPWAWANEASGGAADRWTGWMMFRVSLRLPRGDCDSWPGVEAPEFDGAAWEEVGVPALEDVEGWLPMVLSFVSRAGLGEGRG